MTIPLFDTHAHLISDDWASYPTRAWSADLPVPDRPDYTVTAEALIALMDEYDVPTACVVQRGHIYGYDNSYIIDSARAHPGRLLPVVILDTQDHQTPDRFRDMVRNDRVRGFRMAATRPYHLDTAWMNSPSAMAVWRACADLNVAMTLIFFQDHVTYALPALKMIAQMYPHLPILIDHVGTPYAASNYEMEFAASQGRTIAMPGPPDFGIDGIVSIFADCPNVFFKLTEINFERLDDAGHSPARMIRRLADRFGAERLVWGSDVGQSVRWSYPEKVAIARAAADLLKPDERALFLHDNAARIYTGPGS
ncbi:amidohydrolase family protein [Sphingomonas sp. MMS24-J13]|uniref:amidohydrolase family protein n=1 Tax=Sphingomonas sp. MMS24-J13 TaxID=3238686 RepID=UPI00384DA29E